MPLPASGVHRGVWSGGYGGAVSTTTPQPGPQVGRYRLLTKLGEGGMGVVHLAEGPDGNRVALKVLRPHVVGDDEARERLSREVASLRRVRSPRVAEVLDADPWGETPFVATRYVPGLSLHEHVRREGPVGGDDLRHLAAGLAEAVLAVHSVGVLHRDIKPSNVLLEGRSPVLIDFGLARLADDPRLTVTGWLLGTPGYLAPEILYGEEATTASDVHSWAATLVHAATGRPPFGRGPAMAIMDRVRRGEHDLTGVPTELLPLVREALAPDPAARPTLPTVLADLRRVRRPFRRGDRRPAGPPTMPLALAAGAPDDVTDRLAATSRTARLREPATVAEPLAPPVTGPLAPPAPTPPAASPATTPYTAVHRPAATPQPGPTPAEASPVAWRPPPPGARRVQRGLLLAGLFLAVTLGFALAPYLGLLALGAAALAVRTWSWTADAARERTWRRGRRRWYDGPLAAATAPWYLLVATGGTLMLLLWAAAVTFVTGVALVLFRAPLEVGLTTMGAVLAFTTWWGPGARRVRVPTRALVLRATRSPAVGWVAVAVTGLGVAGIGYLFLTQGVSWEPQPGPPWRPGTLLGDVVRLV